jgi:hypothetical protein
MRDRGDRLCPASRAACNTVLQRPVAACAAAAGEAHADDHPTAFLSTPSQERPAIMCQFAPTQSVIPHFAPWNFYSFRQHSQLSFSASSANVGMLHLQGTFEGLYEPPTIIHQKSIKPA